MKKRARAPKVNSESRSKSRGRRIPTQPLKLGLSPKRLQDLDGPEDPYWRQRAFYSPGHHDPNVLVVGAGGIGSNLVVQLTKLGVQKITVYDHDTVATHNLSTTMFRPKQVGQPKVHALESTVKSLGGTITPKNQKFTETDSLAGYDVVIAAGDNMAMRKLLFEKSVTDKVPFFIDGRIGGEELRVYGIRPDQPKDRKFYRRTLFPDSKATPLPCTAQQVADIGWFTTSLMTRVLRQWVARGTYTIETIADMHTLDIRVGEDRYSDAAKKRQKEQEELHQRKNMKQIEGNTNPVLVIHGNK